MSLDEHNRQARRAVAADPRNRAVYKYPFDITAWFNLTMPEGADVQGTHYCEVHALHAMENKHKAGSRTMSRITVTRLFRRGMQPP